MESPKPPPLYQRWLLCSLCAFLGIFFLSIYLRGDSPATIESFKDHAFYLSSPSSNIKQAATAPPPTIQTHVPAPKYSPPPLPSSAFPPPPHALHPRTQSAIHINSSLKNTSPEETAAPSSPSLPPSSPQQRHPLLKLQANSCNIFKGRWVYDPNSYPLYNERQCPFLSQQVSCQKNGRPDSDYMYWRWEADGCDIPRFHVTELLEKLRGKRVVMVGDSLNRNQWESLACLLYSSLHPSRTAIKLQGSYKLFRAMDYGLSVEFFWSPFLVSVEENRDGDKVLKLGSLPRESRRWRDADVLIFNTGHWWTHGGQMRSWKYYEWRGQLVEDMEGDSAYETALRTWAGWVDRYVDPKRTTIFFRSISPEHKRENLHWCYNQTIPIVHERYIQSYPRSMVYIVEKTIREMKTHVKYLNITRLSEFRRDGHTSVYTMRQGKLLTEDERRHPEMHADCSHWCLPGIPDTWNILLYSFIVRSPSAVL